MSEPNYSAFCEALNSEGLEKAIDSVHLNDATLDAIRITTWENDAISGVILFRQIQTGLVLLSLLPEGFL